MNALIKQLIEKGSVITDGAWGTQLQERGLQPGDCPDEWNLSRPGAVEEVARAYVAAGSGVILSNTFGANAIMLERHRLAERAAEINRAGAEISRRAAGEKAHVFTSIGPSGKMLMTGETTEEALRLAFEAQARALAEGGADGLVIETMSDFEEAKIATAAAKRTGLPVVACMTFDSGAEKDRTMMGNTPEQAAEKLAAAGADVIGANCGQGIEGYVKIASRLRAATALPIWIKANAGLPEVVAGKIVYKATPEEFARQAKILADSGVNFIGGCCGTSPRFIAAVKKALG